MTQKFLVVAGICLLLCAPLLAQIGTSNITGRVTDPTGAVVPGVQVSVVNAATNVTFNSQTNEQGIFRVQSLQPGLYRVTLQSSGFKAAVRDNIDVRTGDTLSLDTTLEVGAV